MNSPDSNDRLSEALATWQLNPSRDPNFRPRVLERIRQPMRETWADYVRANAVGWSAAAAIAITVAGWTGHSIAQAQLENNREQMVVAYLSNLDPRVLATLRQ